MRLRRILALAIPLAVAAVFVRFGVWQLTRLRERKAFNATLSARLFERAVHIDSLGPDTARGHYRRVSASGTLLYDREITYAGRSRNGSPGADLLTPLATAGRDTVVIVNRGWVYSPDAKTVDFARWKEHDSVSIAGYAATYQGGGRESGVGSRGVADSAPQRAVHVLDRARVEQLVGRPVGPYILVQTSDSAFLSAHDSVPVRLELPTLDEGPHQSYAIQWFSFATIAVVGGVVLFRMGSTTEQQNHG
ncbi:MAG: SURF1 family protein [Gemmatimonadales bacterium]